MNLLGTVTLGEFLTILLACGLGLVFLIVLVYLLVRIGTLAFFQAKFQMYRNRNKKKSHGQG